MLTEGQSKKVAEALSNEELICVVRNETGSLIDAQPDQSTLSKEMEDGWSLLTEIGKWQIGVRTKTSDNSSYEN